MKARSLVLILLVIALSSFVFQQQAYCANHEGMCPDAGVIITNTQAPGTQLAGTLTLYYSGDGCQADNEDGTVCFAQPGNGATEPGNIYWFMRIKKGKTTYAFSGRFYGWYTYSQDCSYTNNNGDTIYIKGVQTSLMEAIQDSVLPPIYQTMVPRENWDLQSISELFSPVEAPWFVMADFTLAVKKP